MRKGRTNSVRTCFDLDRDSISTVAQSVERVTAEREVAGSILGARTNTQGLKISQKWRYSLCTASGLTFAWLGWPRKMAVPSPAGDVEMVSPISTFVLNTLTLKQSAYIFSPWSSWPSWARQSVYMEKNWSSQEDDPTITKEWPD